jgi:hypothetical protein
VKAPFEIEWLGDVAEHHFRRLRPAVAELPWGTLAPAAFPAALVDRARIAWTQIALSEYRAALGFAELLRTLLEARAPLDLVGMAGDFVADEVSHVEIAARVAMQLGGGAPIEVDTEALLAPPTPGASALARASEQVVATLVFETFSEAVAVGSMRAATHPLLAGANALIARDEARHTRLGWLYLDWAAEGFDDAERARLGRVASRAVAMVARTMEQRTSRLRGGVTTEGYTLAQVHALGWMDSEAYVARGEACIARDIAAPLAQFGIVVARG